MTRTAPLILLLALATCAAAEAPLRVYLPRELRVEDRPLVLGRVGICRSDDPALREKAESVALGRAPLPGETLKFSRAAVLSRLASAEIKAHQVELTGANEVMITAAGDVVETQRLLAAAQQAIRQDQGERKAATWRLVSDVKPLALPNSDRPYELKTTTQDDAGNGHLKVTVSAVLGDKPVARTELIYHRQFTWRVPVTLRKVAAGEVISGDNATVRAVIRSQPQPENRFSWLGKRARRPIAPGTELREGLLQTETGEVIVERGKNVTMRISGAGFVITALGQALSNGRAGERIRVRNVDSGRIINALVESDGTVRPLSGR